ncbi:MAG: FAD/NAD(P)-binding oxidoreductase [Gammaproteobacteria bacterium]|nr:FAD/NAD(P)-binding oxidoreductase [Gammaproteobacteria bacterium]
MINERRNFLKALSAAPLLSGISLTTQASTGLNQKKVVVVGGGFAGATAARYLRRWSDCEVLLIEPNASYHSCILSNLVLTGDRSLDAITFNYTNLETKFGVKVIEDSVSRVDSANQIIYLSSDTEELNPINYDKLILAPGVAFKYPNWSIDFDTIPHAWKAGPQIEMLKQEIDNLADDDTMVIRVPSGAYRCPPGPYERTCAIADYLDRKGRAVSIKLIDPNDTLSGANVIANVFSGQFGDGNRYPNVEYIAADDIAEISMDKDITLNNGDSFNAQAINYIPDQQAPDIVRFTLHPDSNQAWASVNPLTYASTSGEVVNAANIHVIGDSQATLQPKAGHIANAEAKICADAIIRDFLGMAPYANPMTNSACFTPVNHEEASWISAVYRFDGNQVVTEKVGNSPEANMENYQMMFDWANNLFNDSFG